MKGKKRMSMRKNSRLRGLLAVLLSVCLYSTLLTPAIVPGEEAPAGTSENATPTPDPHSAYYHEDAQTDALTGWPKGPQIEARGAVLMDLQTGSILYAKNADTVLYPASITKIMTALCACEYLDMSGNLTMTQSAAYGIEPGSSSIYADTGEVFTMEQVMMALLLESANEMALVLAETTSGNVKKFSELMNHRAAKLGCTNTHFNNPHGLTDPNHFTSPRDMAKIARAAWKNPLFQKYCSTLYYEVPPTNIMKETRYFLNHHQMMGPDRRPYEGVVAGKTGYTEAAQGTLVTYAKRGEMRLVCVVMYGWDGCYSDTAALLDYGFNNFQKTNTNLRETAKVKLLPSEERILKNTQAFPFEANVFLTLPAGADLSKVERRQVLEKNAAGIPRVRNDFYYEGNFVGAYRQYEQIILPSLLKTV